MGASYWSLHSLSLSCLRLFLPLLTVSDSVTYGAKYDAQSSLIALRLSDFFLIKEIPSISFFTVNVDVVLDDPLLGDVWMPIEVVQGDFVQGEVRVNVTTDVVRV